MLTLVRLSLIVLIFGVAGYSQTAEQIYDKALGLFQERDLIAARREFSRLVQTVPDSHALKARYFLGRIALLESKPTEAVKWLEPVAASDPPIFDADAQLAKAYLDTGQLEKASALIERSISRTPWDGALHYRLGRIYQQIGQTDKASQEFAESVRLKTEDRESVQLLLECARHITSGEQAEALRVRNVLLANPLLDPDVLVAAGLEFAAAGMHLQSLEPFETAAKRDPAFFQAQYNTGLALLKLARAADAIPPLEAALRLNPSSVEASSALSVAYVLVERYADALPVLEGWHERQPANSRASMMLALAHLRTGSPAKAVPLLERLLSTSQKDPKPYFLLIEALNAIEQQKRALDVADKTVQLFADIPQAHLAKAQQLARVGRYAEAGPEFARTLEQAPSQLDAILGLAEVQQKAGEYLASLESYQRALALDATNPTAALGAARDLVVLQRTAEARQLLEASIPAHPENAQLHYELSRVYARIGERDLAAEQTRLFNQLRAQDAKAR